MRKDPKAVVKEIVNKVGKPRAEKLLIAHEISPSTAGKLVRGKYKSVIGVFVAAAIEKTLEAAKVLAA